MQRENMFGRIANSWGPAKLHERMDPATFTLLVRMHQASVVHFLYRMVQDRTLAEELAVEAFLQIYRSTGGPAAQPTTRLFGIATDLALKELPKPNERGPALPGLPADVAEEAKRAVGNMPGKQRAAVLMHKYHHMNSWQIADVLGCPASVARSLLVSAYDQLRVRLAACDGRLSLDYMAR
jgi:RNA polymerase sigma-70 factor (ECF subfamily)